MDTEKAILNDLHEIESFRDELAAELGGDATPSALKAGIEKYAQGVAEDLEFAASRLDGYTSAKDSLNARAYAIRKRFLS